MYNAYCRMYQKIFKLASPFLPWREPELLEGANSLDKLPDVIKDKNISRILIVTDSGISALGLMNELLSNLQKKNIEFLYMIKPFQIRQLLILKKDWKFIKRIIARGLLLLAEVLRWIAPKELVQELRGQRKAFHN